MSDSTPEDLETAHEVLTHDTLPAELIESDRVQRLVELKVLEVRADSGEYLAVVRGPRIERWVVKRD